MKTLVIVNGTMGVGKSTVCRHLLDLVRPAAWLDGDWCWTMSPFVVSAENKAMVIGNITHMLRAYLTNSGLDTVIFSWVMHLAEIFEDVLAPLADLPFDLHKFSLVCTPEQLTERLQADIDAGLRQPDIIGRSLERMADIHALDTVKIDVGLQSPEAVAADLSARILGSPSTPRHPRT